MIQKGSVERWSVTDNHIFFRHEPRLNGIFIIYLVLTRNGDYGYEMWKQFASRYDDIYFSTEDPSYIGNHCKFHGYLGKLKVYKYAP